MLPCSGMPDCAEFDWLINYDEVLDDKDLGHLESDKEPSDAREASTSQDSKVNHGKQSGGLRATWRALKSAPAKMDGAKDAISEASATLSDLVMKNAALISGQDKSLLCHSPFVILRVYSRGQDRYKADLQIYNTRFSVPGPCL